MLDDSADPALAARCEWAARLCALAVAALGVAVLLGWALDIAALKSLRPGWESMKANSALGLVLAGVSLAAAGRVRHAAGWRSLHLLLAAAVALLGLLSAGEHLFALDFGIDRALFPVPDDGVSTAAPGRMSLSTAAGLAFSGLALILMDSRAGRLGSQVAAFVGNLIGVLALLGYAYGVAALYGVAAVSSMALHTAAGLVTVNLGVLLARPQRGLIGVVTSRTAGGVMARRLLPLALIAPFLIGWLRIQGERLGLFDSAFGIALVSLAYVVLFTAFVWRTAHVLRLSEQRRFVAERARCLQQAQLTGIIDSAMDAIIMADAAQRVVLFNPAAEQMFGRKAADVIGGPLDLLLPQRFRVAHFEHVRAFGAAGAANRRIGGVGAIAGMRANGEEFPIEASTSQLEVNGDKYFTAILRDITASRRVQAALRESEERERGRSEELSKLLDAVPAAVWFARDAEATVISGNQLSYEWLLAPEGANASSPGGTGDGQGNVRIVKDGVALAPAEMPLQRAAAGAEVRGYEFDLMYPDGNSRHVLGNATPLLDEHGRSRGAISAFVDITARRQAELAIQAARAEAEQASNAKSRFLAAASHDLRQPLSALSIYANMLRSQVAPAGQPHLANLKDCIGSLNALLTDLLDLSKLEAGVVTPNLRDFPVPDALASLLSIHAPEAQLKGIQLRCVATGLIAHTDPILFKRILGNLIGNAIRYTDRGGVLVGCRRRGARHWVEVWDTGIGIAEHDTAVIFEEFRQLGDEARTRGSGLGLAIVAKAAALLGLEIRVRSRPGRGSVFAIELPLGRERTRPAPQPGAALCRSLRIALIEDNAMVREALVSVLEDAGHAVLAAASGKELRAALGNVPPDIVVSDYRLAQGETGFDVITAARAAMGDDLPAILITGDTDPKLIRSMADRGIVVVHKPLDLETLQAYLEDLTCHERLVTH
jgi:PAS domain S-box-containing protein